MQSSFALRFLTSLSPWTITYASLGGVILLTLARALYNLFLHPLRSYPGPLLSRALSLPQALRIASGRGPVYVHRLHERYGPVVRLGPNHLSYVDLRAWKDIYGHRTGAQHELPENPKSPVFYVDTANDVVPSIAAAARDEHARLRRALAHGFSERAMRQQEGIIQYYVDLLARRMREKAGGGGERLDMVRWYNWTAFDVVGDLVFAESFKCLQEQEEHPFVSLINRAVHQNGLFTGLRYVGLVSSALLRAAFRAAAKLAPSNSTRDLLHSLKLKLQRRLDMKEERDDLFEGLIKMRHELNLDMARLQSNAFVLVLAGSETTATLLSGATYLLLKNPDALEKLQKEVRSAFGSADEITIASVSRLPYLLACLNEALRLCPPGASNFAREVHGGGEVIAGKFVPEKTVVEVQQYAMNYSSAHWHEPYAFRPERFLHKVTNDLEKSMRGQRDGGDRLEAMQAFGVGPRNCIGKNLAYAEMRLVLARVIYDFDMRLADESRDWMDKCKIFTVWVKEPLYVYLTPVERS